VSDSVVFSCWLGLNHDTKSWLEDVGISQMVEGLKNYSDSREVAPVFLFYMNNPVLTSGII